MLSRWNQHLPVVTSSELVECLIFAVHQEATLYHSHKEMLTYFVDVALWEVSKEQDSRCDEINRPYTLLTKQRSMVCQVYHLLFHGTIWSKLVCPTCKVDLKAPRQELMTARELFAAGSYGTESFYQDLFFQCSWYWKERGEGTLWVYPLKPSTPASYHISLSLTQYLSTWTVMSRSAFAKENQPRCRGCMIWRGAPAIAHYLLQTDCLTSYVWS